MKNLLIFVSIIATNTLFASTVPSETMKKQETIDILIKNDNLIEKELSTSRVARISREVNENSVICIARDSREVRENRVVRMGRNSRGIRENRIARIARNCREVRENRIVRMGKNSKGIRLARVVHVIDEVKENKHPSIKLSALIKKLPL